MKKALAYGAGLIALYLGVYYYTGAGTLISDSTSGATSVIAAFQGRGSANSSTAQTSG